MEDMSPMTTSHTTPENLDSATLDFARALNPQAKLQYIRVLADDRAIPNECFSNVAKKIETHGGEQILGWQVWEWPGVFAEAEAHAIWQSPDFELYDITPKTEKKIAFIADPSLKVTGSRINNIRHAIIESEIVEDFISAGELKHKLFGAIANGTSLQHWQVSIQGRLELATALLQGLLSNPRKPNQRCPCGSALSYGVCHRLEVKRTLEMATTLCS
ncbi:SEC-C metal-binding domain-containing protein [Pseudomonas fulva]|uniref:SEC-C metal-binding domain-containing protein n=1 Tax=Pseudomonas fulva TaxID=47880 RepID=UPI0034D76EFD